MRERNFGGAAFSEGAPLTEVKSIAVIGCGGWGPNHLRNFNVLSDAKVIAAVDTNLSRLTQVLKVFPGVKAETDYKRVLENPAVDAVVVATPTNTHYAITRDALSAGKHVLCEKPLCETGAQARDLVALARSRGLILMVGHTFLFNSGVVKLKELIDAGELGSLYYLSSTRTNLGPIRLDVNAAYDLASHDVSIFNWLLGSEPEFVSATGSSFLQPGIEDVVFISLRYPNNVLACIQASWLNPKKVRVMSVVGSKKMVTWDDLELHTPVAIYDRGANVLPAETDYGEFLHVSMWDGDVRLPKVHWEEPLKVQDHCFVKAIQQGNIDRSEGMFGLNVVKTLEAISTSLKSHGNLVGV